MGSPRFAALIEQQDRCQPVRNRNTHHRRKWACSNSRMTAHVAGGRGSTVGANHTEVGCHTFNAKPVASREKAGRSRAVGNDVTERRLEKQALRLDIPILQNAPLLVVFPALFDRDRLCQQVKVLVRLLFVSEVFPSNCGNRAAGRLSVCGISSCPTLTTCRSRQMERKCPDYKTSNLNPAAPFYTEPSHPHFSRTDHRFSLFQIELRPFRCALFTYSPQPTAADSKICSVSNDLIHSDAPVVQQHSSHRNRVGNWADM
jgi:hypothetical protein